MNSSDQQTVSSTINSNSNNNDEGFHIFYNGTRVKIVWENETYIFSPILRLCSLSSTVFLLLNQENSLYEAKFDHENFVIHMKCIKLNVVDVQYCRDAKQVFLVLKQGTVVKQSFLDNTQPLEEHHWMPVVFDPLELSEDGVRIKRICSSSEATLFLSISGDIYALGNCGVHFSVECDQPKLLRLFKNNVEILDIVAGENFFIFLARKEWSKTDNQLQAIRYYGKSCNYYLMMLKDLIRISYLT